MSLINDLLCDLQERKSPAVSGYRLAGLQPVRREPAGRKRWLLVPVAGLLLASSALAVWYVDEPSVGIATSTAPAGGTPMPPAVHVPVATAHKDQRLASLLDFSRSLNELPSRAPPTPAVADRVTAAAAPPTAARAEPTKVVEHKTSVGAVPVPIDDHQSAYAQPAKVAVADPRRAGLTALAAGRLAVAETKFRLLVAAQPRDAQAWLYLSRALDEQGRAEDVEAVLGEALATVSEAPPIARVLARRLLDRGAVSEALQMLEAYRDTEPLDPEHDAFIAAVQQRLGRHELAADRYRSILAVRPEVSAWWVGLAISEEARGRQVDALQAYRRARNVGNLDARLADYADQRIAAMQGADPS